MAKIKNPFLFSKHFAVSRSKMGRAGFIDPFLNVDTKLFVDPLLLDQSSNQVIRKTANNRFNDVITQAMKLASLSKQFNDTAWKGALKLVDLSEAPEICLGYGGSGIGGSGRSTSIANQIIRTLQDVMQIGMSDPELIKILSVIEAGIGPDTISDWTTNSIKIDLATETEKFVGQHGVKVEDFYVDGKRISLPRNPFRLTKTPIILVPYDILRDLPIATDWADIDRVIAHNNSVRDALNRKFASLAKATATQKKEALRDLALAPQSDLLRQIRDALKAANESYDVDGDPAGVEVLRTVLTETASRYPLAIPKFDKKDASSVNEVVKAIILHFIELVEKKDLGDLLWDGDNARHEKSAQLLFYGIAEAYCKANNVDISPESDHGGGPVDFKFSTGYGSRILVEIKLSTGKVRHGYEKQLKVYEEASAPKFSHYVVIRVGTTGQHNSKMRAIRKIKAAEDLASRPAGDIFEVDGTKKLSASKRN